MKLSLATTLSTALACAALAALGTLAPHAHARRPTYRHHSYTHRMANTYDRGDSKGKARTTNYYTPLLKDQGAGRAHCTKESVTDDNGHVIARLCESDYKKLKLEGAAVVEKTDGTKVTLSCGLNKSKSFHCEEDEKCLYGSGASGKNPSSGQTDKMCLIPYKSVACDTQYYKPGTVIHINKLDGARYTDDQGQSHISDGNFICADTGGRIKGIGRFDVFTGFKTATGDFTKVADIGSGMAFSKLEPGSSQDNDRAIRHLRTLAFNGGGASGLSLATTPGPSVTGGVFSVTGAR